METPANEVKPIRFAKSIEKNLKGASSKTEVYIRFKSWIEEQEMGSFLSVAKGSSDPSVFLEIHYRGSLDASEPTLVFVEKGITFDSGGISIKPSANMDLMRADVFSHCICSQAQFSHLHTKNGKTIQVDSSDVKGRPILADVLCYAHIFNPKVIINAATLTGAIDIALGSGTTGVFTKSS
ncbi:Cytosol aminopeptidase [Pteropus alecto]|uniref:Cytosol aminopeptidase n=1 Tax=Pteropus alecto TaxID=9402 RepID=L5K7Z8_PTEAL|nr:Cytosol aminopeptidase [Pteropus alecto]